MDQQLTGLYWALYCCSLFLPSALEAALQHSRLSMICSGSDTGDATDNYIHEKSSTGQEKHHRAGTGSGILPQGCHGTKGDRRASLAPWGLGLARGHPSWQVRDVGSDQAYCDGRNHWVQLSGQVSAAIGKSLLSLWRMRVVCRE